MVFRRWRRQSGFHFARLIPSYDARLMRALPFVDLEAQYARLKPRIDARIQGVLEHGRYIMGPEVQELEERLAEKVGCQQVIGLSSGTDALLVPMMAWGIGPGDAVFLPSFTFVATAEVPLLLGAEPVFVDVQEDTFNIDPQHLRQQIRRTIEEGRLRPRLIVGVDLFGLPADWTALRAIADELGLFLLDDAAQSLGAAIDGRRVGTLADATSTSFYPAKPLGAYGDAGALFTEDDDLAALCRSIRVPGYGAGTYDVVRVGINGRLDSLQAAILLAKLEIFDEELVERDRLAHFYSERLRDALIVPAIPAGHRSAWAQYTLRTDHRDALRRSLSEAGIPTAVHYPLPMHLQAAYSHLGGGPGVCPVSERLSGEVLSLPMHPYLARSDAERICAAVLEFSAALD